MSDFGQTVTEHVDTNSIATTRKPWQTPAIINAVIKQNTRFTPTPIAPYDCCYFSATS